MSPGRVWLCLALTSVLVLTGALLLPVDAGQRPACVKGSTERLFTDCTVRPVALRASE